MKLSKFLMGVALCTASSILWVSCKKTDSFVRPLANETSQHFGGAVKDDPALVAKVPVIISAEFLAASKDALLNGQVNIDISGQGKGGGDRTKPTVIIASPLTNSTVSGTVSIQISASDNVGVSVVSLSVDGSLLASSNTSPYSFSWNTSGVASGTHTITATAKDAAGNSSSASIQVGINTAPSGDVTVPVISITSPLNGSAISLGATVSISVSASDNIGVSAVSFSVDGTLQISSSTSPYSFSWNTTGALSGTHTLTATAKDAAGNTASYPILVTVNTTVIPSTTIPASFQLTTPTPGNQGNEGSCVAFAIAYGARSIEQYYKTNATTYGWGENIFSPEYVYNQTKLTDCATGTSPTTVLDLIKSQGVSSWQAMPYSDVNGCSLQPDANQIANASSYKISSYALIPNVDQVAIKTMVASKHAVIITIIADNSFTNAGPGFIWNTYSGSGALRHTLIICGYDDAKNAYKVMNSWGATWGDSGFSWIGYDYFPQISTYDTYAIQ